MEMHKRRGAEREYTCNVCGEVFRKPINTMSIKLAVGNVRRRRPGEQKGKELMNQVCINENISITDFVFIQMFFLF
jgi:hypothetical protein